MCKIKLWNILLFFVRKSIKKILKPSDKSECMSVTIRQVASIELKWSSIELCWSSIELKLSSIELSWSS